MQSNDRYPTCNASSPGQYRQPCATRKVAHEQDSAYFGPDDFHTPPATMQEGYRESAATGGFRDAARGEVEAASIEDIIRGLGANPDNATIRAKYHNDSVFHAAVKRCWQLHAEMESQRRWADEYLSVSQEQRQKREQAEAELTTLRAECEELYQANLDILAINKRNAKERDTLRAKCERMEAEQRVRLGYEQAIEYLRQDNSRLEGALWQA